MKHLPRAVCKPGGEHRHASEKGLRLERHSCYSFRVRACVSKRIALLLEGGATGVGPDVVEARAGSDGTAEPESPTDASQDWVCRGPDPGPKTGMATDVRVERLSTCNEGYEGRYSVCLYVCVFGCVCVCAMGCCMCVCVCRMPRR
jgi:hypothetical protein